ncbi:conserved protein, unknown function, partial [Hepatocystis sp. ex Piliocolobus tephrosceles]
SDKDNDDDSDNDSDNDNIEDDFTDMKRGVKYPKYISNNNNRFFNDVIHIYVKQQYYIYSIIEYNLKKLDIQFSNSHIPICKNKIIKLIKLYYYIDFDLEEEIIKHKNINNLGKYTKEFRKITNIHKRSIKRQIENIKRLWIYILQVYETRFVNINKFYKRRKLFCFNIIKFFKNNLQLYYSCLRGNTEVDMNVYYYNRSFVFIKKRKKKSKKIMEDEDAEKVEEGEDNRTNQTERISELYKNKSKVKTGTSSICKSTSNTTIFHKNTHNDHNLIKNLESMLGIYLAKRYFHLFWIIVYYIEMPKKTNIPYPFLNNIVLLLLEKLQINDLILSKEYINVSYQIHKAYKDVKTLEDLQKRLEFKQNTDYSVKMKIVNRFRWILNLLCSFR